MEGHPALWLKAQAAGQGGLGWDRRATIGGCLPGVGAEGVAKGKKLSDKRETSAKRDWDRQKARLLKQGG